MLSALVLGGYPHTPLWLGEQLRISVEGVVLTLIELSCMKVAKPRCEVFFNTEYLELRWVM